MQVRPVVACDLAARFSAVVALDQSGEVLGQWDSAGLTHRGLADKLWRSAAVSAQLLDGALPLVVVEDLPPHVPSSTVAKNVAMLQGRILQRWSPSHLCDLYFVPPALWERDMGVFRKDVSEWEALAAELGYKPPDLLAERGLAPGTRGQATAVKEALKQRTDYVAAYLIGRWAQRCMAEDQVWDMTSVRNYED